MPAAALSDPALGAAGPAGRAGPASIAWRWPGQRHRAVGRRGRCRPAGAAARQAAAAVCRRGSALLTLLLVHAALLQGLKVQPENMAAPAVATPVEAPAAAAPAAAAPAGEPQVFCTRSCCCCLCAARQAMFLNPAAVMWNGLAALWPAWRCGCSTGAPSREGNAAHCAGLRHQRRPDTTACSMGLGWIQPAHVSVQLELGCSSVRLRGSMWLVRC